MAKAKRKETEKGKLLDFGVYDRDSGEEMSITKLADEFRKSLEGTSLKEAESNRQHLEALLEVVKSSIPIAEAHYKQDSRERNCYALTNLVTTASNILSELSSSDDSEVYYQGIIKYVIEFQKALLQAVVTEIKLFESKILPHIDSAKTSTVKTGMEYFMMEMGEVMRSEYDKFLKGVEDILGVSPAIKK